MSRLLLRVLVFASVAFVAAPAAQRPGTRAKEAPIFRTSETCLACHNKLATASGEDVSIGSAWRGSIMANASRDPYWQASVRREVMDRPALGAAIEDECATCHMPMARAHARAEGRQGEVFRHLVSTPGARAPEALLAADGVSCTLCHQVTNEKLGTPDSFTGGFVVDTARRRVGERAIFGPFAIDRGHTTIMRSATGYVPTEGTHVQQSELCATCHTLYTHARGAAGESIARLPEQVPYQEWRHSAYRGERSCQSCHMPVVSEPVAIAAVLGEPRAGLSRHTFRGGNFFMLDMLQRYRAELGVTALPSELAAAARGTVALLQSETARVGIVSPMRVAGGGQLSFDVTVENLTAHKLPTGYPSRRAWLHVLVRDRTGRVLFESGAFQRDGRIQGNDNDADPLAFASSRLQRDAPVTPVRPAAGPSGFEPHHTEIRRRDQVQVYESMMVDARGGVTTGLLSGVRFAKDNRLLPRGFDKATAGPDIAVHGAASTDPDFTASGDRVRFVVDLPPTTEVVRVEAELWFQPIAFRWAENLRAYDSAAEPRRFVEYYASMAASSAQVLARDAVTLP